MFTSCPTLSEVSHPVSFSSHKSAGTLWFQSKLSGLSEFLARVANLGEAQRCPLVVLRKRVGFRVFQLEVLPAIQVASLHAFVS